MTILPNMVSQFGLIFKLHAPKQTRCHKIAVFTYRSHFRKDDYQDRSESLKANSEDIF